MTVQDYILTELLIRLHNVVSIERVTRETTQGEAGASSETQKCDIMMTSETQRDALTTRISTACKSMRSRGWSMTDRRTEEPSTGCPKKT